MVTWVAALLTGMFGVGGVLGGAMLTARATRRVEGEKRVAEDSRRWLNDRRLLYAKYLTLCESLLREIDGVACFLQYSPISPERSAEDEDYIVQGFVENMGRWDEELQPLLEEIKLIATPKVADIADRMSGALLEISGEVEAREYFVDYYPAWFQGKDMLGVLRNAMREEIGIPTLRDVRPYARDAAWPWLADRPSKESYRQRHPGEVGTPEREQTTHCRERD